MLFVHLRLIRFSSSNTSLLLDNVVVSGSRLGEVVVGVGGFEGCDISFIRKICLPVQDVQEQRGVFKLPNTMESVFENVWRQ